MARQVQLRRGTTAQHAGFTGAVGEVTVDTDKNTLLVHDGSTVGGIELSKKAALDSHLDNYTNDKKNILLQREAKQYTIPAGTKGWVRIMEHQNNVQSYTGQLNITIASQVKTNGGQSSFMFSSFRNNIKALTKLHSLKLSEGVQKIRIVDPNADWTSGNYIDVYVDVNSGYDLILQLEHIYRKDIPTSDTYAMKFLASFILDPTIPVGYRITEVDL